MSSCWKINTVNGQVKCLVKNKNEMKYLFLAALTILSIALYGQDKYNYVHYNKLTELKGTPFVTATIENFGKISIESKFLL